MVAPYHNIVYDAFVGIAVGGLCKNCVGSYPLADRPVRTILSFYIALSFVISLDHTTVSSGVSFDFLSPTVGNWRVQSVNHR